ncbi:MAG: LysR family transcriptional regulator, partial [Marivivens sp.]|nr:LysR family transcriptional regulator [Marivivens sp.]NDH03233.1 LysR family transcriptional regulator [Marivivens sp.]
EEVKRTEGVRLDHIVSELPREKGGAAVPISYQRLLLGCRFPDQSRGLVSVVVRTYDLCIDGLPREEIERMPSDLLMDIR